jgi:hypothetical protein
MDAGEIRSDIDPDTILDILYGPLYLRLLVRHRQLDLELADQVFDLLLPGLAPKTPATLSHAGKNGIRSSSKPR